jgi:TPR repeat protein
MNDIRRDSRQVIPVSIRDLQSRIVLGDLEASRLYALALLNGCGVEQDAEAGFNRLLGGSEENDPIAQCDVGFCYHMGQGTTVNIQRADEFYKKSSDQNCPNGQTNHGYCLATGEGIHMNIREAARLFKIAADRGLPEAWRCPILKSIFLFSTEPVHCLSKSALLIVSVAVPEFPPFRFFGISCHWT